MIKNIYSGALQDFVLFRVIEAGKRAEYGVGGLRFGIVAQPVHRV